MSTNFLNRRMDLEHIYGKHFINDNTFEMANMLKMDTSYPVKLSGKIIKLFTAAVSYPFYKHGSSNAGDDWLLINTEGEVILRVKSENIYDFAGRIIDNNIGDEKAYPASPSVFTQDDYVMAIIDFDDDNVIGSPSIHLCSQTNFENFITSDNGNGSNIKLFNITGETIIDGSFDNLGIDEDVLDVAIEFENEEAEELDNKTYSLVRNDSDNVLWEKPINNNNVKSATPVANVNNVNINGVNLSIQNFIFPEINTNNCYRGWDATESMKLYKSIEGSVNDDFINTYCFTNEELQNLAIFPMAYLNRFYENMTGDKNDYVYAIGHNEGPFSGNHKDHPNNLFYAYPIKKSDNRFKILDAVDNKALTCGGSRVSIASLSTTLCDICGSYWDSEHINGYNVTHHVWKPGISAKTKISFGYKQIANLDCCSYSKYINNNKSANTELAPLDYSDVFDNNSSLLADITRFIDFFGNNDNNYKETIKKMSVALPNNGIGNGSKTSVMFRNDDDTASIIGDNTLPINVVALYPEFFENILYGSERSSNTSIRNCLISDGKDYKFKDENGLYKRQATWWWGSELSRTIVYNLFDRYNVQDNLIKPTFVGNSSMNVIIDGENSSYVMRPISHFNDNSAILIDKDDKHNIVFIVNYLMLNTINTPYYETEKPDYNNAEMSTQSVTVLYEDVKIASECIEADGSGNLTVEIDGVNYDLYTVRRENNTLSYVRATTSNLKDTTSDSKGITYLYYFDETNAEVHRLKYFFKVDGGTGVRPYDFFKDTILFKQTQVSTSSSDYRWEFNNAYISAYKTINEVTEQAAVDNYNTTVMNDYREVILYVVSNYKFFPYNLSEGNLPAYEGHNALSIAELDYSVNHACSENVYTTLKELVGSDYAVVINCKAPHASAIKVNDSYVYNIASYNKWLKNTKVSNVFITGMFPYINGCGIRKEYYNGLSLYDFFLYAVNRDLGRKLNSDGSFYTLENDGISFFTKDEINKIKVLEDINGMYYFKDASNNDVTVSTNLNFKNNINKKNIFGFNPITIEDNDGEDVSEEWNSNDAVYLIKNDTGSKTVYSIAMNDGNPNNPTIMSTNGNIDVMDAENIKWSDLLLALNNNKSIDILSTSLKSVKSQIKTLMTNTQNINSDTSMDDNITQADADAHDTNREGGDEFSPSSSHYKEHDAVFDSEHNVYNFNYGYGFTDKVREINNRGVIVFESKDFKTNQIRSHSVGETPDDYKYQTVEGTVYARRMYINNDGLLCTKEYFDNEAAEYTPAGGSEPVYPENPTTIAALLKKIEELENRIAVLEGN